MAYDGTKYRTWDRSTPNDGLEFEAEYNKIYANTNALAGNGTSAPDKTIQQLANESNSIKTVATGDSPYTIADSDAYSIYSVDTSGGDVTITLPTLADNQGKKIKIVHTIAGNTLTVDGEGAETLGGEVATIELTKINDMLEVQGVSSTWAILNMKVSAQLRLSGYAGYGSTDNRIFRFTTKDEGYGNVFSENHTGGYNANAEGIEITINLSGKYEFQLTMQSTGSGWGGLSLNSSQLTTNIESITAADRLAGGRATSANNVANCTWSGQLANGDVVRAQGDGTSGTGMVHFSATFLGN